MIMEIEDNEVVGEEGMPLDLSSSSLLLSFSPSSAVAVAGEAEAFLADRVSCLLCSAPCWEAVAGPAVAAGAAVVEEAEASADLEEAAVAAVAPAAAGKKRQRKRR